MNWQPIETAPKDGTWVLLALYLNNMDKYIPKVEVCRWYPDDGNWDLTGWVNSQCEPFYKPTHWSYIVQP